MASQKKTPPKARKPYEKREKATNVPSYMDYFKGLTNGDIPMETLYSAFQRTSWGGYMDINPFIQNARVKRMQTLPAKIDRKIVADWLQNPNESELGLRQVSASLASACYPYFNIVKTYQDVLSYHNYVYPTYLEKETGKKDEFMREWRIADKIRFAMNPEQNAHQIVGECGKFGKVFYTNRFDIDRSHNKVNYAFMQRLPQDYCKIVGFNNVSKYTVAFNLMWFLTPGANPYQFGDLFIPYLEGFETVVKTKAVYNSTKVEVDIRNASKLRDSVGSPEIYQKNGKWFYWVTLPADKVWAYEIDDTTFNAISPLAGLFLSLIDMADTEAIQMSLIQNPLVSLLTGTIPYADTKDVKEADAYKLSPTGESYWKAMFYNMMLANNTSGIGFFGAPFEDMKLQSLAEAPNAAELSGRAESYAMQKAGLGALIPATTEPRASAANISAKIAARYAQCVYNQFENMMNNIIDKMKLKYEFRFKMFGNIFDDEADLKAAKEEMTLGILPAVFRYNALKGQSVLDDISMSIAVDEIGVLDLRKPLVTSYSAKKEDGEVGRPKAEEVSTDGNEQDLDSPPTEDA